MDDIYFSEGKIYQDSVVTEAGTTYILARLHESGERRMAVIGDATGFEGTAVSKSPLSERNLSVQVCQVCSMTFGGSYEGT